MKIVLWQAMLLPGLLMLTASASMAQTSPDRQSKQRQDGGERRHFEGPQEERDARRALFRMTRATKSVAYSAREVVTFRGGTVEFDVWVDPKRGSRRESADKRGDVIVDDLKHWWVLSLRMGTLVERNSMQSQNADRNRERLVQLKDSLKAVKTGDDAIAGRPVDIVVVSPRLDAMGITRKFWIDRETGLQLKSEERDSSGRVLRSSYFTSVQLNADLKAIDFSEPKPPAGISIKRDVSIIHATFADAEKAGIAFRTSTNIPAGYTPQFVEVTNGGKWVTQHWGNGTSVLSYSRIKGGRGPATSEPAFRQIPGGRRGYVWNADGVMHVVIAPLPDDAIRKFAAGLR